MKIAVITLPFRTNYGQILQGYALQTTLESLGHKVVLLDDPYYSTSYYFIYPLMCVKRFIRKFFNGESHIDIFTPPHERIKVHTQQFIDKHLHIKKVHKWNSALTKQYDAFIVGSDQVWRPQYFKSRYRTGIELAYLSFAEDISIKRIAYAASFGTDECEYTTEQLQNCSRLAKLFNAISVREDSGVHICKEFLNVNAQHVIDPTLLLNTNDYTSLIPQGSSKSDGSLLVYVLDENESISKGITQLSIKKGLKPFSVKGKHESSGAPLS